MILKMAWARTMMLLRVQVVRTMRRARGRRHSRGRLLKLERQLGLVRNLRSGRRSALRRNGWHSNGLLEHLDISLVLVGRSYIPGRKGLVSRGNASVEIIGLIGLLRALLLHALNRIELVID
jgi:hypothetical protein